MRDTVAKKRWGDFKFDIETGLLGQGGNGSVYKGLQISLDRLVAIKILNPKDEADPEVLEALNEGFIAESKVVASLDDPRIVRVIQAGFDEGQLWFAMELLEGETIDDRLAREGAFTEPEAARIAAEIARALDAANRRGIIHRDIKPGNVTIDDDGNIKVADWGLSKVAGHGPSRMTSLQQIACTPDYASPEQATGKPCDFRSDIYSLGAMLHEMLCEVPPFQSDSPMEVLFLQCSETPKSPRILNPLISEGMEALVLRCLRKRPEDRYASYDELIADLDALAQAGQDSSTHAVPPTPRRVRPTTITLLLLLLATLLLYASNPFGTDEAAPLNHSPLRLAKEPPPAPPSRNVPSQPVVTPEVSPPIEAAPVIETPPPPPPPTLTPADLDWLARFPDLFEKRHTEIQNRSYLPLQKDLMTAGNTPPSPLSRKEAQSIRSFVDQANRVFENRMSALREAGPEGPPETLSLKDGSHHSGTIVHSDAARLTIREEETSIEVRLQELATGDFIRDIESSPARVFCALDDNATALFFQEAPQAWQPVLVRLALLQLRDAVTRSPIEANHPLALKVKTIAKSLGEAQEAVASRYPFTKEDFDRAEREENAWNLLLAGDDAAVIKGYPKTAAFPLAAVRMRKNFEAKLERNIMDMRKGSGQTWLLWKPDEGAPKEAFLPDAPSLSTRVDATKVPVTLQLVKPEPGIRQGILIRFKTAPEGGEHAGWTLSLRTAKGTGQIEFRPREIRLVADGRLEARQTLPPKGKETTVHLIPHKTDLFVFANGFPAFHRPLSKWALSDRPEMTARKTVLHLFELTIPSTKREENR